MNMCHEEGIIPLKQTHIAKTGVCVKKYFFSLSIHMFLSSMLGIFYLRIYFGGL